MTDEEFEKLFSSVSRDDSGTEDIDADELFKISADFEIEMAEAGEADAQYNAGVYFFNGTGVEKDHTAAAKWFARAADQGDTRACCELGLMYVTGDGVERNYDEAAKLFRKGAMDNDLMGAYSAAQYMLGEMYRTGKGVARDFAEAMKWYRKAALNENEAAKFTLELLYSCGGPAVQRRLWGLKVSADLARKHHNAAFKRFRTNAGKGNADAMYGLGLCYKNGFGVRQDAGEAAKWLALAAEKGDSAAQVLLGEMYMNGDGVEMDPAEAARLFSLAADKGFADAMYGLAWCRYCSMYADEEHRRAEADKWYGKAAELYIAAAEAGDPDAMFSLSACCFYGYGVEKDPLIAEEWFDKAAEAGSIKAVRFIEACKRSEREDELREMFAEDGQAEGREAGQDKFLSDEEIESLLESIFKEYKEDKE